MILKLIICSFLFIGMVGCSNNKEKTFEELCSENWTEGCEPLLPDAIVVNDRIYQYPIHKDELKENEIYVLNKVLKVENSKKTRTYEMSYVSPMLNVDLANGFIAENKYYKKISNLGLKEGLDFNSSKEDFEEAYKHYVIYESDTIGYDSMKKEEYKNHKMIIRPNNMDVDESFIWVYFNSKGKVVKIVAVKDTDLTKTDFAYPITH